MNYQERTLKSLCDYEFSNEDINLQTVLEFVEDNYKNISSYHLARVLRYNLSDLDKEMIVSFIKSKVESEDVSSIIDALRSVSEDYDVDHIYEVQIIAQFNSNVLSESELLAKANSSDSEEIGIALDYGYYYDSVLNAVLDNQNVEDNHLDFILSFCHDKDILIKTINHPFLDITTLNSNLHRFEKTELFLECKKRNQKYLKSRILE